jgi:cytochrome c biogenesis protein CcmG/thiol:disulfide interchange protein DsbE
MYLLVFRKWLSMLVGIGLSGCFLSGAAQPIGGAAEQSYALIPPAARQPAPNFAVTGVSGHKLTLARERGKVVLLDFWAVDCGGCKIEIPWYVDFDRKYRSQGLALIGLDMYGEAPVKIRPFMAKSHMDYPVAVGTDAIGASFHVTEMPLTLLIDRKGRIAVAHAGIVDRAQFDRDIQTLLAEK